MEHMYAGTHHDIALSHAFRDEYAIFVGTR
jgi:hypothetical protein